MEPTPFSETGERHYFTVSQYKLSVMYLMTLGLYAVYWFYKNWKLQQPLMDKKISPVWRSIFSIFFTHSLFDRVRVSADQQNTVSKYSYSFMATLFVSLVVVSNILGNIESGDVVGVITIVGLFLSVVALYPLYVIQGIVNNINKDPHGVFNNEMTLINYAFIVIGAVMWFFIAIAALANFGVLQIKP